MPTSHSDSAKAGTPRKTGVCYSSSSCLPNPDFVNWNYTRYFGPASTGKKRFMSIRLSACAFGLGASLLGCDLVLHSSQPSALQENTNVKKDSGIGNPKDSGFSVTKDTGKCDFDGTVFRNAGLGDTLVFKLSHSSGMA